MLFGLFDSTVRVGVKLDNLDDPAKSHGVIQLGGQDVPVQFVRYTVDRPSRLRNPSREVLIDMHKQFQKMGLHPMNIQVRHLDSRKPRIYRTADLRDA